MKDTRESNILMSHQDDSIWLITYADLMTLLLVFFVMLYTLAYFETNRYKAAVESIKVKMDQDADLIGLDELMEVPETADTQISIEDITGLRNRTNALKKDLMTVARNSDQSEHINTRILDNKIIVSVQGQVIFQSGDATLNQTALPVFDQIIQILKDYPDYNINIKGHTDDVPISTGRFPSNWELSAIRATTVLKYLIQQGVDPGRLTATGYGDIMPLVPNTSEENRAINRRVEFVLEKKKNSDKLELGVTLDNRDAFRYLFKPHDALQIQFKSCRVMLRDISATGLSFRNQGFCSGDSDLVEFELTIPNYLGDTHIAVRLQIIAIDAHDICHCRFEDCTLVQQEIIHKYLLEMQKKDLARKRP